MYPILFFVVSFSHFLAFHGAWGGERSGGGAGGVPCELCATYGIESLYCGPIVDQKRDREFSATRGITARVAGCLLGGSRRAATVTRESRETHVTARCPLTPHSERSIRRVQGGISARLARPGAPDGALAKQAGESSPPNRPGPCVQWTWRSPRPCPTLATPKASSASFFQVRRTRQRSLGCHT